MITYPTLVAILKFLPFPFRKQLARRVKGIEGAEKTTPYIFDHVVMMFWEGYDSFMIDKNVWFEGCTRQENDDSLTYIDSQWADDYGELHHKKELLEKNALKREEFVNFVVGRFFKRSGNFFGTLKMQGNDMVDIIIDLLECRNFRIRIKRLETTQTDTRTFKLVTSDHFHHFDGFSHLNIGDILKNLRSAERPIGSIVTGTFGSDGDLGIQSLTDLYQANRRLNPKLALAPPFESVEKEVPDCTNATLLQYVTFDLGYGVLAMRMKRVHLNRRPEYRVMFHIVTEDSVTYCEHKNWLAVFEEEGCISYVDLA